MKPYFYLQAATSVLIELIVIVAVIASGTGIYWMSCQFREVERVKAEVREDLKWLLRSSMKTNRGCPFRENHVGDEIPVRSEIERLEKW